MTTLSAGLQRKIRRAPDDLFCTFIRGADTESITFGSLYAAARSYARVYTRLGIRKHDVVVIVLQHSPHLFYSFVGAMLIGAVPSFMPFPSPKQDHAKYWRDHERLFERLQPALIVSYAANIEAAHDVLPGLAVTMLEAGDTILDETLLPEELCAGLSASPDEIACLQHSSGTTGLKKGVTLTHRAIVDQIDAYAAVIGFSPLDRIASWLPLYHDMGFIACFMMSLIRGTHLVALDAFEWVMRPAMLLETIASYRATFAWLPNFAFSHIVKGTKLRAAVDLSSLRALINCSEPCKVATFERFLDRFGDTGIDATRLHVSYAMAENVFAVTQTLLDRPAPTMTIDPHAFSDGRIVHSPESTGKTLLSCGPPIPGVAIEVRSDRGERLEEATIGEIFISSPFLFEGYYQQPDLTAQRLQGGWYRTGDLGFLHDGELYVTGRVDDMIVTNGRNYYAHEIEEVVNTVAGVLLGRSVAIPIDDPRTDATVVVVLAECGAGTVVADVSAGVRKEVLDRIGLAVHSVAMFAPGSLVKTTSGKISRSENKKMYVERSVQALVG